MESIPPLNAIAMDLGFASLIDFVIVFSKVFSTYSMEILFCGMKSSHESFFRGEFCVGSYLNVSISTIDVGFGIILLKFSTT